MIRALCMPRQIQNTQTHSAHMNLPPFARWNNPVGNNYPRKLHFRRIKFPAVKVLQLRCWGSLQIIAQQLGNFSCRASTLSLLTVHKHGAAVFFCHSRTPRRAHAPDRGNLLLCHCEPRQWRGNPVNKKALRASPADIIKLDCFVSLAMTMYLCSRYFL